MFALNLAILFLLLGAAAAAFTDPHCDGKQVIVHLFEWRWTDIATECERFLSTKGYCGVQISPPSEHVIVTNPPRPWWEVYQPVSYKLTSRCGTEAELTDMVRRCNAVGVRIYADLVINHMAGMGRRGRGTAGTSFNSDNYDFHAVPYSRSNFHSYCPVNNYADPYNVRNCYLVELTDLDQSQAYVRNKIIGYINNLIDIGIKGFRVDAAKHMHPKDIAAIQSKLNNVDGGQPFFYHEVIDQNDGAIKVTEYTRLGYVTEFRYCQKLKEGIDNFGQLGGVVDHSWHMTQSDHAFVFVDNHDNQRGHGSGGAILTHKTPLEYKMAVAFMLANDYGFTRVMSSYFFTESNQGPPQNVVSINTDGSCGNGWICEHRWKSIANMVAFRNAVKGTTKQNWYQQGDQVAFSRGNKGFFAMSKQANMDVWLNTGMTAGSYCNLITDCQNIISVDGNGRAHIVINSSEDPIVAFVVGGPSGDSSGTGADKSSRVTTLSPTDTGSVPTSWRRTVIFIHKETRLGEDVFIRGGIDHAHRSECSQIANSNECSIPIRHRDIVTSSHFGKYNAWNRGDNYLDWYGAEPGQGTYQGTRANGSPTVWTTNKQGNGHNSLNSWGPHYWLIDVEMDCGRTEHGWFEFKAIANNQWESFPTEFNAKCTGNGNGQGPYWSTNHWARCGYLNVFQFNQQNCQIDTLD